MPLVFPPLYVIMDAALCGPNLRILARELAQAGVKLIQYRDKTGSAKQALAACRALVEELAGDGVRLIVNDRVDLALMSGAAGVHVGQEDLPVEAVRRICGASFWVGLSTHNLAQLAAADRQPVDYLAFGPIFPTTTKQTADPPVGVEGLARARAQTRWPLAALRSKQLPASGRPVPMRWPSPPIFCGLPILPPGRAPTSNGRRNGSSSAARSRGRQAETGRVSMRWRTTEEAEACRTSCSHLNPSRRFWKKPMPPRAASNGRSGRST